jgi:hypothetical protein
MALIEQQDVVHLVTGVYDEIPARIKEYLDNYPKVRIVSMQVLPYDLGMRTQVFLIVESV